MVAVRSSLDKTHSKQRQSSNSSSLSRDLVIELLKDKEQLRKNDVKDLASQKNLEVNDGLYGKVMKELCSSRGALWTLKSSAG